MGCEAIHPETGQQCRVREANHARHVAGYYPDQVDWENEDFVRNTRVEVDRPASRLNSIAHQVQRERIARDLDVPVGAGHPQTSVIAAARAKMKVGEVQLEVFDCILSRGTYGATCDEVEEILNRTHQSVSSVFTKFANQQVIEKNGMWRNTRQGNGAEVWIIVGL